MGAGVSDKHTAQGEDSKGGGRAARSLKAFASPSFPLVSDSKGVTRPLWASAAASEFLQFRKLQIINLSFFLYRGIRGDKIYLISNYTHPTCENPSSMYSPKITKNYKAKKGTPSNAREFRPLRRSTGTLSLDPASF